MSMCLTCTKEQRPHLEAVQQMVSNVFSHVGREIRKQIVVESAFTETVESMFVPENIRFFVVLVGANVLKRQKAEAQIAECDDA